MNTSGSLNNNNANNGYRVVPDCSLNLVESIDSNHPLEVDKELLTSSVEIQRNSDVDASCSMEQLMLSTTDSYNEFMHAISFKELYKAALLCSRGVKWKSSVQKFLINLSPRIHKLRKDLLNDKYKLSNYVGFRITEPKERFIYSTRFVDRVFQKSMCINGLYDQLTKGFIYDNCACLRNRGADFARKRFRIHMRRVYKKYGCTCYVLKLDISKYFQSIPRSVIEFTARKRIKNEYYLKYVLHIINHSPEPTGLILGSEISQLLALAVLDDLDHMIKEKLKVKHYIRYMDDLVLFGDKEYLKSCWRIIEFEINKLGLKLNKKSKLFRMLDGVEFLGFNHRILTSTKIISSINHKSIIRERRKIRRMFINNIDLNLIEQNLVSWIGYVKKGTNYNITKEFRRYLCQL